MNILFRFSLFFGLMVVLTSSIKQPMPSVSGLWSEHWIDSDVDYVDTVSIEFKDQKLEIELLHSEFDWNPQFVNESFDGSILRFQVNANNVTNFFIFQRSDDPNQLFGKVYTWKGEIKKVYLVRKPNEKE